MIFPSRESAGDTLAEHLADLTDSGCVVAGIPRGGLVVARAVAHRLRASLAVAHARKMTMPIAEETAFGAVGEDGRAVLDYAIVAGFRLSPAEIESEKNRVRGEIERRRVLYGVPPLAGQLAGKTAVLVDDGLATGLTMQAAVNDARAGGAAAVVVAVPCGSAEAVARLRPQVDRVVCPKVAQDFRAVSDYYVDFAPVTDDEVMALLARPRI